MLFNSNAFYLFLPIVFLVYWLTPRRFRWGVLLVSSYYFYMSADAQYVLLLLLTTAVSYGTALGIQHTESRSKKKFCMGAALLVCLGLLFFFKYFNFLSGTVTALLKSISLPVSEVTLELVLPVGISFYIFQSLGYVIDVYKGKTRACAHFGKYAAFVSFFPLLLAGPIERAEHLLPQLEKEHSFNCDRAIEGAKLIAWGYFKKIAIADVVVSLVDVVYDNVTVYTGLALGVATFFYAFQVYCDFSGYSDIARGVAKLLDIELMTNFKSPYFAASLKEFWSRWHISLSTWFRDYVYIPLGGSRRGEWRTQRNLLITFLVSGLWHGARWTYVICGGLHSLGQIVRPVGREAGHGFDFPCIRVHNHHSPFFKALAAGVFHDFLDIGINGQHHPRLYRRSLSDLRGKAGNPTAQAVQLVDRLGFLFKGSQVFVIAFFNASDAVAGVVQITDDVRGQLGGICPDRDGIFLHPRGV